MTKLKHKLNIFPEMQEEDYLRLKNDIEVNGFDSNNPIWLFNGDILDGWNRQRACNDLGVNPTYVTFNGTDIEAIDFVLRTNKRRNLNSSQWACIATEADDIISVIRESVNAAMRKKVAEARIADEERKRKADIQMAEYLKSQEKVEEEPILKKEDTQLIVEAAPVKIENQIKTVLPIEAKVEIPRTENETSAKIATTFNTNRTYVNEAKRIKAESPEIFEQIKSGAKTITEVKKAEKVQIRTEMIEKQKEDIKNNKLPALSGLYGIVSVDPPWNYGREYDPESSRVANPYPEMTVDQIKAIELPMEKDSVIFLWTTHKFLPDAFEILKHWGFEYKATLVWNKEKMGMGAWFRMQCEFCLFAVKGNPIFQNTTERDIIIESRREHSRKPDTFYKMVDKVCVGRKLEYFSREKRDGWDIFGNDTEKF